MEQAPQRKKKGGRERECWLAGSQVCVGAHAEKQTRRVVMCIWDGSEGPGVNVRWECTNVQHNDDKEEQVTSRRAYAKRSVYAYLEYKLCIHACIEYVVC